MTKPVIEPVFLLGAGRSGTKFLRDTLASSRQIEEIPYDIGYVWRYGNEQIPHDELVPDHLTDSIRAYITKTLPKLTNPSSRSPDTRYLLEKSVPNTLRPLFLYSIYPNSKFIHLIRDGRLVTESAMRMWKEPPNKSYLFKKLRYFPWSNYKYATWYIYNILKGFVSRDRGQMIWGPRYNGIKDDISSLPIETVCARQWKKCIETSTRQLEHIPSENILQIRYEDLIRDKNALEAICKFLDIRDTDTVLHTYDETVIRSDPKNWNKNLTDVQIQNILHEISLLNKKLGYS